MLYLQMQAGGEEYVIPTSDVEAVLPYASLKQVVGAPEDFAGVLVYRGVQVAVIDCGYMLAREACAELMSTRIALVRLHDGRLVGLVGERMTRVVELDDNSFSNRGIVGASFLGKASVAGGHSFQIFLPEKAVRPDLLALVEGGGGSHV